MALSVGNLMPRFLRRASALSLLLGVVACGLSNCAAPRPSPESVLPDDPLPDSGETQPRPSPESVLPDPLTDSGETQPRPSPEPAPSAPPPSSGGTKVDDPLASLRTFTRVVLYIKDNYAYPERIKPKEMLLASLESVEKAISDVKVDGSAETGRVMVTVGNRTRGFGISHVNSLWKMSFAMKDVFGFIDENLRPEVDRQEVEYAATNGMLSALDRNSVLIPPHEYSEMKRAFTTGYGSIGVSVRFNQGEFTLVKTLSGLPAAQAGLQKGDVITRIGEESTSNMDLKEVMNKLRGPVGTPVSLTVKRARWSKPRVMTLTRARIVVPSVRQKLLSQGVGYVRLKDFGTHATQELEAALKELTQKSGPEGLKGLVLDVRGNSGGQFEQSIQIADLFLSSGTILVTTGLGGKLHGEKRAQPGGSGEGPWPIAVLVDSDSASATEIVTGALKVQNRAVVIGRRTFGNGSVQVLYDFPDGSALQLTIASYRFQGDRSIQGIGITPDIELLPARITRDRVALFAPRRLTRREEQERSPSEGVQDREQPAARIQYLALEDEGSEDEQDRDSETLERIEEDFEVRFARDVLLQAPSVERGKILQQAQGYVERIRSEQAARIQAAITGLGVDWSPGPTPVASRLAVTFSPDAHQRILAGDKVELEVTVENQGAEPVKRLRAWTDSPGSDVLDRCEFLLGALAPGERKSWKVPVQIPESTTSRREPVTVRLQDDSGMLRESFLAELNIVEQPRPAKELR
jgi:carboxyl-terminal processing protease